MNARQDRAYSILAARAVWEQKQRLYYQMRHDGLRRQNKPFPTAADSHFPLIDMQIGNVKPFWSAQVFGGERLTDLVCMSDQQAELTEAAADFLHFELMYRSEFRYRMEQALDPMLLRGRGILKITWDTKKQGLKFRAVDPLFVLMAEQYDDFDTADYFVEVQHLTVDQYRRERNFNQDEDLVRQIKGKPDWNFSAIKYDKQIREGVTHSSRDDVIVLWNYYERGTGGWRVFTFCPMAWDKTIREPYTVPYEWQGQPLCPFYSLTMEVKDEGWYAPRGLAELNAAFEAYCTKLWNEKSDAMTFGNRPLFTADNEIPNTTNIRFMPGELIPGNIKAVQMPQPSFSFAEEINFTRQVSEQRSRMPDFGITREDGAQGTKSRTATENNRIAALQDVGADYNGEIMRSVRMQRIYTHCWALLTQFKPKEFAYYAGNQLKQLPEQVLHDRYLVVPSGISGTRQQRLQRAANRFQMFRGAPNVDQDQLVKDVIAADDPRNINKLLIPQNQKQQVEYLDQVIKINAGLADGFPVPVLPSEDQGVRIKACLDWLQKQAVLGAAPNPIAIQAVQQQIAQRFEMLKQQNPDAARSLLAMVQQMEQQLSSSPPANTPADTGAGVIGSPAPPAGPVNGEGEEKATISMKLPDFYPSERAQVLAKIGIQAAGPDEILETEGARAGFKQAGSKPRINGAIE